VVAVVVEIHGKTTAQSLSILLGQRLQLLPRSQRFFDI
jgi:hypothetical protein